MNNKIKMICTKAEQYLFYDTSKLRSIILTLSLFLLYFLSYAIISRIYYNIATSYDYILMPQRYFPVFFCIAMLPVFGFLFFKFNIWTNFWKDTEKPCLIDYLFFLVILLFLYFSFNHGDITFTSIHGKILLDMVYRGMNVLDFYDYNQGTAVYQLPQYILFGIWSIPVKIGYMLAGLEPLDINQFHRIRGITLWWYKLLPVLFYAGSSYMIYKIGIFLQMGKSKAKWMALVFLTFPMASFSQFIFGQYDSVGVFFELIMVYFFLQKRLLKASFVCMIAMTFKIFPIFIFLPLLLLVEKRVFRIIRCTVIAVSGYFVFNLLFLGSEMFRISGRFNTDMFQRFLFAGLGVHSFGTISFFLIIFTVTIVIAWFINTKDKDDFAYYKYILYIPLCVYSAFFSLVLFHPQWILILVPYFVINIFVNKNTKGFIFIAIAANAVYLLKVMSFWEGNVDANMLHHGIFPSIFGFTNSGSAFKSLNLIATLGGLLHVSVYFTLFVSMLLINVILSFPSSNNIKASQICLSEKLEVERDVLWINGLLILLFAVPSLLLFFTGSPKQNVGLTELSISRDVEVLKQNISDIISVDVDENSNIILECGMIDPMLYLPLQSTINRPSNYNVIELLYNNSETGYIQIYYDYGNGLREGNSSRLQLESIIDQKTIQIPIVGWRGGKLLKAIRIDPPDGSVFVIQDIRIISYE
jgi:hypothetical protein